MGTIVNTQEQATYWKDRHIFYGEGIDRPSMKSEDDLNSFLGMGGSSEENFYKLLAEYRREKNKWAIDESGLTPTANTSKPLKIYTLKDISKAKTDKRHIIEGMLYPETVNMLHSPPACFKSLLTLYLGLNVSLGRPFLKMNTRKTNVLICDKENNLTVSQDRINKLRTGEGLKRLPRNVFIIKQGDLLDNSFTKQLFEVVDKKKIGLVVFDTLHRFADYDENSSDDLNRMYMKVFQPLTQQYKCTVLFLHHSKKDGGYRGTSDFMGMVDTAYNIFREGKSGKFTLNCEKARAGEIEQVMGEIDFGDDFIRISRRNEAIEQTEKIDKLKAITRKCSEFAPFAKPMKRKDFESAFDLANIEYSVATLKRALLWLSNNGYFEYDEANHTYSKGRDYL